MLVLRQRVALRCAYCHDALSGPEAKCSGCGTVLHDDCRAELVRCPTFACLSLRVSPPRRSLLARFSRDLRWLAEIALDLVTFAAMSVVMVFVALGGLFVVGLVAASILRGL